MWEYKCATYHKFRCLNGPRVEREGAREREALECRGIGVGKGWLEAAHPLLTLQGTNDIVRGVRGHQVRPPRILARKQQFILSEPRKCPEDQSQITASALLYDGISPSLLYTRASSFPLLLAFNLLLDPFAFPSSPLILPPL